MTDNEKLEAFLWEKVACSGQYSVGELNLEELKQLRELVQMAIVEKLCKSAPLVYKEIFQEREKL